MAGDTQESEWVYQFSKEMRSCCKGIGETQMRLEESQSKREEPDATHILIEEIPFDSIEDNTIERRIDTLVGNQKNNILWLGSEKWLYSNTYGYDLKPIHNIINISLTAPRDDWAVCSELLIQGYICYVVLVITEPILLQMMNKEYGEAVGNLISEILRLDIAHSVLMDKDLYSGTCNIFNGTLYNRYLYFDLFKAHQTAHYSALENLRFKKSGNVDFDKYFFRYKDYVVLQMRAKGLLRETDTFLNYLELHSEAVQEENPVESYDRESITVSQKHPEILSRFKDVSGYWKDVRWYLNRYGKNRFTMESRRTLERKSDEMVFHALINTLGIEPNEEEKTKICHQMREIITTWKHNKRINIVAYSGSEDMFTYLDDYIGEGRHIVFNRYILHDRLFADEMDQFITMFQEYISSIRKIDIRFEKQLSAKGIVYAITSRSPRLVRENFMDYIGDFEKLLSDICEKNESSGYVEDLDIKRLVEKYNIPKNKADNLIRRYSVKMARMRVDIKYDYQERKLKILRALEENLLHEDKEILDQYLNEDNLSVPSIVLNFDMTGDMFISGNSKEADIIVNNYIQGDYNYGVEDETILALIKSHEEGNKELVNALNTLKDPDMDKSMREKAEGKLRRFLIKAGETVGDVAIKFLMAYLDQLLKA